MQSRILADIRAGIPPATPHPVCDTESQKVWNLLGHCWEREPSRRPSAQKLSTFLQLPPKSTLESSYSTRISTQAQKTQIGYSGLDPSSRMEVDYSEEEPTVAGGSRRVLHQTRMDPHETSEKYPSTHQHIDNAPSGAVVKSGYSATPNSTIMPSHRIPNLSDQDYLEYQHFFPLQTDHRRLRVAMHRILNSDWKLRNELEPTSQDILQFSTKVSTDGTDGEESGGFKYRCLLYHGGEKCNKSWTRAERMLAHLRGVIDLRPFACEGAGGGW